MGERVVEWRWGGGMFEGWAHEYERGRVRFEREQQGVGLFGEGER